MRLTDLLDASLALTVNGRGHLILKIDMLAEDASPTPMLARRLNSLKHVQFELHQVN